MSQRQTTTLRENCKEERRKRKKDKRVVVSALWKTIYYYKERTLFWGKKNQPGETNLVYLWIDPTPLCLPLCLMLQSSTSSLFPDQPVYASQNYRPDNPGPQGSYSSRTRHTQGPHTTINCHIRLQSFLQSKHQALTPWSPSTGASLLLIQVSWQHYPKRSLNTAGDSEKKNKTEKQRNVPFQQINNSTCSGYLMLQNKSSQNLVA